MDKLATDMSNLANTIARSLSEYLGDPSTRCITKSCSKSTSFLRLNHYPNCPFSEETFGLVPHTDSSYLTIVHPDKVGKLQLKINDSKWVSVRPKPGALIVNIGDLFQAWSNDVYKSVEHRVMTHSGADRHSIVYFLCPSYDSLIGSCTGHSPIYRSFTFGEFRKEVDKDVKQLGCKVGLPRFHL
ncbi:Gibberellin 2-oxidase [Rhynchospora pubera]|uniref:Gibberellin 2-oxidase n=1 Tax=Rhynchospora pubera TaxID=906938 RepID=A0AAV8E5F0_9POAL|nr:Gibberellin 2-oxidase [Rhynchospora pubera]